MRGEPRGQPVATATAPVRVNRVQPGVEWQSWRRSSPITVATLACAVHVAPEAPLTSTQVGRAPPGGGATWWSRKVVVRLGIYFEDRTDKTYRWNGVCEKKEKPI